ncbi:MAG: sn-glycerol-3-phosphate ABC transporter ATP-binding protein UgpC [bacterium]
MANIVLGKVTKHYPGNEKPTVKDLDISISDGEFVVFVGPSGCGKSTVLRLIAGLIDVTAGKMFIGGRDITDLPPKDRNISMVFQNYALFPHLTVRENIGFGLSIRGIDRDEAEKRVNEAAGFLGLIDLLHKKPKELSGGQRQRVAVGRAMVKKPEVFLFDEPLSNLDATMRTRMRAEISRLHRKLKTTAIYVTHDQCEAMTMADRMVVLNDGIIQQCGTPLELYLQPCNTFVATFIGSPPMNLFAAEPAYAQGQEHLKISGLTVPLPRHISTHLTAGHKYMLGIRPEHIYLSGRTFPGMNLSEPVDCEVELAESMGNDVVLHCNAGGLAFQSSQKHDFPVKSGDKISVVFALDKSHIFSEKGERIV